MKPYYEHAGITIEIVLKRVLMKIKITIPVTPVPKGRPRFVNGRALTPKATRQFEKVIRFYFMGHKLIDEGPIAITLLFKLEKPKGAKREFPCVRPDIDNYVKAIFDAAEGMVFKNDGQVCDLIAYKRYCDEGEQPHIVLEIEEMK